MTTTAMYASTDLLVHETFIGDEGVRGARCSVDRFNNTRTSWAPADEPVNCVDCRAAKLADEVRGAIAHRRDCGHPQPVPSLLLIGADVYTVLRQSRMWWRLYGREPGCDHVLPTWSGVPFAHSTLVADDAWLLLDCAAKGKV